MCSNEMREGDDTILVFHIRNNNFWFMLFVYVDVDNVERYG